MIAEIDDEVVRFMVLVAAIHINTEMSESDWLWQRELQHHMARRGQVRWVVEEKRKTLRLIATLWWWAALVVVSGLHGLHTQKKDLTTDHQRKTPQKKNRSNMFDGCGGSRKLVDVS